MSEIIFDEDRQLAVKKILGILDSFGVDHFPPLFSKYFGTFIDLLTRPETYATILVKSSTDICLSYRLNVGEYLGRKPLCITETTEIIEAIKSLLSSDNLEKYRIKNMII
jgi:hypothetical protein